MHGATIAQPVLPPTGMSTAAPIGASTTADSMWNVADTDTYRSALPLCGYGGPQSQSRFPGTCTLVTTAPAWHHAFARVSSPTLAPATTSAAIEPPESLLHIAMVASASS